MEGKPLTESCVRFAHSVAHLRRNRAQCGESTYDGARAARLGRTIVMIHVNRLFARM